MTMECPGSRLEREHVVLTGAAGLTGQALCRAAANDFAVHALSRGPKPPSTPTEVCWHRVDLAQPNFTGGLPPQADHVVHLAQSSRFRDFPGGAPDVFAVNVAAAARLLEWAAVNGASHFVLASTGGVYPPSAQPLRERDPLPTGSVRGYYAASKLAAELLAGNYASEFALTVLRPFFLYGAGQEPSMLVPRLVRSVREGTPIRLAGSDGFRFTPTHVDDAVRAVLAALRLDGHHTINLGGPEVLSLREAGEQIGRTVGVTPVFDFAEEPAGDLVPDLTSMRELLGHPVVTFSAGLQKL